MFAGKENLATRQKHWKNFNSWETIFQETELKTDLNDLLKWYAVAWKIAKSKNPDWVRPQIDQEKLWRLQRIRNAFAELGELK